MSERVNEKVRKKIVVRMSIEKAIFPYFPAPDSLHWVACLVALDEKQAVGKKISFSRKIDFRFVRWRRRRLGYLWIESDPLSQK